MPRNDTTPSSKMGNYQTITKQLSFRVFFAGEETDRPRDLSGFSSISMVTGVKLRVPRWPNVPYLTVSPGLKDSTVKMVSTEVRQRHESVLDHYEK